jgi:CRISPR-associated protein Csm5
VKYQLTCLTPTLIGDGQELAPIDYMVWKDQVNVLDQRRIFRLFAKGPRLDGYLAQLKRSDRLDFASWGGLAQNYAGRRIVFEHPSMSEHFERAMPQDLFIRTFSSMTNGIYVPGSALKGALRTGALFAGLTEDHWKKMREQLSGDRPARRVASLVEDRAVKNQLKGLMAGDSAPVPATANTMVYLLRTSTLTGSEGKYELGWKTLRGSSKNALDGLPTFVEMAKPGTVFEGAFNNGDNKALESARKFAGEILRNQEAYAETAGLASLKSAAAELRTRLESLANNQCLLPLGWGGGFLGKAAVADGSQDHVREVLRKLPFYARAIQTGMPFPKTRRIVFSADKPATMPGWTLFEVVS